VRRSSTATAGWHETAEPGSRLGLELALLISRMLGYRFMHGLLYPIAFYYCLVTPSLQRTARPFFTRAQGRYRRRDLYWQVFRFAESIVDRIFAGLHGRGRFSLVRHDFDAVEGLAAEGRGGVFLGAHLGALELSRKLNPTWVKTVPLSHQSNRPRLLEIFGRSGSAAMTEEHLPLGEDMGSMLQARKHTSAGRFLGALGDRVLPGGPTMRLPFLGREAEFPVGPYRLAGALKCPLVALFAIRVGERSYELHARVLSEKVVLPRDDRDAAIRELLIRYVRELERFCRMAPHQWYNFHDFWGELD